MNAASLEPVRWTARRWLYAIGAVFVAQAGLILILGERPRAARRTPPFRTTIQLAVDPWAAQQLAEWPGLSDPTKFALPNAQGFSGAAWINFSPVEHQLTDWTEPPQWLALDPDPLGRTFSRIVATNAPPPLLIADLPMPNLSGPELAVPPLPMRAQSLLRIEGDLAGRALLEPIPLPAWAHTDLLAPSVVQLVVDADGFTGSTILLGGSGLKEADQFALNAATAARFEALPRNGPSPSAITIGRMVFRWHTVPPPATNAVTGLP